MVTDIVAELKSWANTINDKLGSQGIYAFGSLVYRDGLQFTKESDVDLVVCFPDEVNDAYDRMKWIEALHDQKITLEANLSKLLSRDPAKPICSVVVPTSIEIDADLHKDAAPDFFKSNLFLDLISGERRTGFSGAGRKPVTVGLAESCIRFVQKKRNAFLGVSANGTGGLSEFHDETDPLPKDVMRHGAMAAALSTQGAEDGAQYDTQFGLDFVTDGLYAIRDNNEYFRDIHNRLSIRRGARGQKEPVTPRDTIFLAEWIYDQARNAIAKQTAEAANNLPTLCEHTTVFFAERFGDAFPGVRGLVIFDDLSEIKERLERLLREPISFHQRDPIWWWRDGNNSIKYFSYLADGVFLMGPEELKIRKIGAVKHPGYQHDFVYVETDAMAPTGLYDASSSKIEASIQSLGFCSEEYGLVDKRHLITRAEFDDGSARIDGKLQSITAQAELRVRYITSYNFLIAAQMSPINNNSFDPILNSSLNSILRGESDLESLAELVRQLPIQDH